MIRAAYSGAVPKISTAREDRPRGRGVAELEALLKARRSYGVEIVLLL